MHNNAVASQCSIASIVLLAVTAIRATSKIKQSYNIENTLCPFESNYLENVMSVTIFTFYKN